MVNIITAFFLVVVFVLPAAAQDATPEILQALDLTEEYVSEDGYISFRYPEGWAVGEGRRPSQEIHFNGLIANGEEMLRSLDTLSGERTVRVTIAECYSDYLDIYSVRQKDALSVAQALRDYFVNNSISFDGSEYKEFDEVTVVTVEEEMVAQFSGRSRRIVDDAITQGATIFVTNIDGLIAIMNINGQPAELEEWQATAQAIAASVRRVAGSSRATCR